MAGQFPNDTFIPIASIETYECLDSAFDGFLGTCARRAAEHWTGPRFRVRHRAARVVQSLTVARPLHVGPGWFCSISRLVHYDKGR
jgi:hypothetical protein